MGWCLEGWVKGLLKKGDRACLSAEGNDPVGGENDKNGETRSHTGKILA